MILPEILMGLANGALIGTARALNGRLSRATGPARAAFWNHAVGFAFLSLVLWAVGQPVRGLSEAPVAALLGGLLGVVFVAINSHVVLRIGVGRTTGLVVSGQMLTGVAIASVADGGGEHVPISLAGSALIIAGVVLAGSGRRA